MDTPRTTTVYLHTSKMRDMPNYEETWRMITDQLVSDKANFVVVMSDKIMNCGMLTKEKIMSHAAALFKIFVEVE